jgi:hypothetical protein
VELQTHLTGLSFPPLVLMLFGGPILYLGGKADWRPAKLSWRMLPLDNDLNKSPANCATGDRTNIGGERLCKTGTKRSTGIRHESCDNGTGTAAEIPVSFLAPILPLVGEISLAQVSSLDIATDLQGYLGRHDDSMLQLSPVSLLEQLSSRYMLVLPCLHLTVFLRYAVRSFRLLAGSRHLQPQY